MEEKTATIDFHHLTGEMDPQAWQIALAKLPPSQQEVVTKYHHWQDRHRSLMGKLMLMDGLRELGITAPVFDSIQYTAYGRPYIRENVDFNISHSGEFVLYVQARGIRVGIDIEKIKAIDVANFRTVMNPDQWKEIRQAADPLDLFFTYWALKESVIKANGKGFSAHPAQIQTDFKEAWYEGETWYLQQLDFGPVHKAFFATDHPVCKLEMRRYNRGC